MSLLHPHTFLSRTGEGSATEVIRQAGIPATDTTLENLAAAGKGPRYNIINGRALYRRADLEQWILSQLGEGGSCEPRDAACG